MIPQLILVAALVTFWWLIKKDIARREGLSAAIWIPTLWVGIIASRNLSAWLGFEAASNTLEGSPADRIFFFGMIAAALVVIVRRGIDWPSVIRENWAVFVFYGYLLVSVLWANSPFSSSKRWIKEFGNILVLLVILTEVNPQLAFRAVFVRCAYVLIPLSVVFIRYFPELGRRYNIHSGEMEAIGVTFQKNSLGAMVLVCVFVVLWDWLSSGSALGALSRRERRTYNAVNLILILTGVYLLHLCDSKTSMVALALGTAILGASRLKYFRRRPSLLGTFAMLAVLGFFVTEQMFGLKDAVFSALGRDVTLTGRTEVWRELLKLGTDPMFGTGFMSLWDDATYRARLPEWVAFSAHNGFLEVFLAGGWIGVCALTMMLVVAGRKIFKALPSGGDYAAARFGIYAMALLANFSESNFACMTPVGFLFLLAVFGQADAVWVATASSEPVSAGVPVPEQDVRRGGLASL